MLKNHHHHHLEWVHRSHVMHKLLSKQSKDPTQMFLSSTSQWNCGGCAAFSPRGDKNTWHFRSTNWRCKPTDRICTLHGIVVELIILIPLDIYIYASWPFSVSLHWWWRVSSKNHRFLGIVHLCIVKDVWLETYVFCEPELNFSTPHFPIWTPDASANSHHQEMERSQASFLASWDLAVFSWSSQRPEKDHTIHGMLRGPGTGTNSANSVWGIHVFLGMEFFDTNLWDLNKNIGTHRKTLGILCH